MENMYTNIKSCISNGNYQSDYFTINCGVRQGENLSPILFSLYLNDLEEFLARQDNQGLILHDDILDTYFKILVLLYGDDTVLFVNNPLELQLIPDSFQEYCNDWKLNINIS